MKSVKSILKKLAFIIVVSPFLLAQTPNLFNQQGYLFEPPLGLGIWNVRHLDGARGENVKIIDVERGWNPPASIGTTFVRHFQNLQRFSCHVIPITKM